MRYEMLRDQSYHTEKIWDVTFIWSILYLKRLKANSNKYKFMGYIGYYLYHLIEKKIFVSKYATFQKKELFLKGVVRGK
jgi:hypothetical protein